MPIFLKRTLPLESIPNKLIWVSSNENVKTSNNLVYEWGDIRRNGVKFTMSEVNRQFVNQENLGYLSADGVDDVMVADIPLTSGPLYVFMAFRQLPKVGENIVLHLFNGGSPVNQISMYTNSNTFAFFSWTPTVTSNSLNPSALANTDYLIEVIHTNTSSIMRNLKANTAATVASPGQMPFNKIALGSLSNATFPNTGYREVLIVAGTTLTTDQLNEIRTYFRSKYP